METAPEITALSRLEGRWTLQLLVLLLHQGQRFSELRAALPGVSANVLTGRLRELENDGLVRRDYLPPNGSRAIYELDPTAEALVPLLHALEAWGLETSRGPSRTRKPGGKRLDRQRIIEGP